MKEKDKNKKQKVTYYDDGSTISDMSCLNNSNKRINQQYTSNKHYHATEREKLATFFQAFKMMLAPTIVVLGILAFLFSLFYFLAN